MKGAALGFWNVWDSASHRRNWQGVGLLLSVSWHVFGSSLGFGVEILYPRVGMYIMSARCCRHNCLQICTSWLEQQIGGPFDYSVIECCRHRLTVSALRLGKLVL